MLLVPFSNWERVEVFGVDFGAAVVQENREGVGRKVEARPVSVLPGVTAAWDVPLHMAGNVAGRDAEGNWWVGGNLTAEAWANVRQRLSVLSDA